jgi:hypothetical protein
MEPQREDVGPKQKNIQSKSKIKRKRRQETIDEVDDASKEEKDTKEEKDSEERRQWVLMVTTRLIADDMNLGGPRLQAAAEMLPFLPHRDAALLLSVLPPGVTRRNALIAANLPATLDPFNESLFEEMVPWVEVSAWLQAIGFTGHA